MNTSELGTLIHNTLSEQLAPTKTEAQGNGILPSVGEAIDAAHQVSLCYQQYPLKIHSVIINALCEELTPYLTSLAAESAAETEMGNKEDKLPKNEAALGNTPGTENLTTTVLTGDGGMVLFEYLPFGVVGSVVPSANPTETIINNSINMSATGSSIYFSLRLGAKEISLKLIAVIEDIASRYCGIRNLVTIVTKPTFEATQQMMVHPRIAVLAITGDPGITTMGMENGKEVIGAGAGNSSRIVDETVDLVKAAEDVIGGASFDYSPLCIAERSLIAVGAIAERLARQMQSFGTMLLNSEEVDKLCAVCLPEGITNKKLVGKSPVALLKAAGIPVPAKAP